MKNIIKAFTISIAVIMLLIGCSDNAIKDTNNSNEASQIEYKNNEINENVVYLSGYRPHLEIFEAILLSDAFTHGEIIEVSEPYFIRTIPEMGTEETKLVEFIDYKVKVDEKLYGEELKQDVITVRTIVPLSEIDDHKVVMMEDFNYRLHELQEGDKLFMGLINPRISTFRTNESYYELEYDTVLKLDEDGYYKPYIENSNKNLKYDKVIKEVEKAIKNEDKNKKQKQKEIYEDIEENGVFTQKVEDDMLKRYEYLSDKYAERITE